MKIGIASDHRGYALKEALKGSLIDCEIIDYGTTNTDPVDYPDYAFKLGKVINQKEADLGILICGTGIGMSIAANKVKGIRCAHVASSNDAILAREHNNANVIAFGKNTTVNEAIKMVDLFIATDFKKEERHIRRIQKITKYENGEYDI